MEAKRAMYYQTFLVSCWLEQDETTGKTSWRFRLEIPRTGDQHMLTNLLDVMAVIDVELHQNKEKNMTPEDIVKKAEAAYQSADLERIMALFDPTCIVYFGGKKNLQGHDEIRAWHHKSVIPVLRKENYKIRKNLLVASGDTIGCEWYASWTEDDGTLGESIGGEFWKMLDGRLVEWKAY